MDIYVVVKLWVRQKHPAIFKIMWFWYKILSKYFRDRYLKRCELGNGLREDR